MYIDSSRAQSHFPPPNNSELNQWADKVQQFIDETPQGSNSALFSEVLQELLAYKNGEKQFKSIQDVLSDLQTKFFNGSGQLDVYANSGLGSAQPVQDFLKIFGITPPLVTPIDELFMKFQRENQSGLPSGGEALLTALHNELMNLGSNGTMADFKEWANQEMQSADYKNASPDAKDFFNQFLSSKNK